MLLTEEEARKKWCPFAGEGRLMLGPSGDPRCIASECMAWRWKHKKVERERTDRVADQIMNDEALKTGRHVRRVPHGCGNGYDLLIIDGVGYCGLAGEVR